MSVAKNSCLKSSIRIHSYVIVGMLCFLFATIAPAEVKVSINDVLYSYDYEPRLLEVLSPIALNNDWYWPSAKLYRQDSEKAEEIRNNVIQGLSMLANNNINSAKDYQSIIEQIKSWDLRQRVDIAIDFEYARFSLHANPKFESGDYMLSISDRPTSVYIFGAVVQPRPVAMQDNQCLRSVLKNVPKLDIADLNYIYLIAASGEIKKLPVAYWNHECAVAPPGAHIFVPLKESQWSKNVAQLNKTVASLAINRVNVP